MLLASARRSHTQRDSQFIGRPNVTRANPHTDSDPKLRCKITGKGFTRGSHGAGAPKANRFHISLLSARLRVLGHDTAAAGRRSRARAGPATAATGRRGGATAAAIRLACGLAGAERRSRGGEVDSSSFARDRTRPYVHRRCMSPYVSRDQRGAATPGRSAAGHG